MCFERGWVAEWDCSRCREAWMVRGFACAEERWQRQRARASVTLLLRNCSCCTSACGVEASDRRTKNNQEKVFKTEKWFRLNHLHPLCAVRRSINVFGC